MLSYPAATPLSTRTLNHLAGLAHLRNCDTYTRLAAGFGIGVATAWRYVRQAVSLLAAGRRRPGYRHAPYRTRSVLMNLEQAGRQAP